MKRVKLHGAKIRRNVTPKTKRFKIMSSKYHFLKRRFESKIQTSKKNPLKDCLKPAEKALPSVVYRFLNSQLENYGKSAYGRRWTAEEKRMALQIFLSGPKAYGTLTKFFTLPHKRTLQNSLSRISIKPGFLVPVLSALQRMSSSMQPRDKLCSVMFDEMKIKPGLAYYSKYDQIIGYDTCSKSPSTKIATHALVFMVRGIAKEWKQVFGIFFSTDTASSAELNYLVCDAVATLQNCEMNPQCIICDMGSSNQRLFSSELGITEDKPYFFVNEKKIFAMFDPPHLLKCLRNNFYNYKCHFSANKTADWEHIRKLYEMDVKQPHRVVKKLTPDHIKVYGLNKMCVRRAAQVFSHSVASALDLMSYLGAIEAGVKDTEMLCSIVNDLFDSQIDE